MSFERVPLSELLVEFREALGTRTEPTVLTLTEQNGFVEQSVRFRKRQAISDTSKYKLIRRDDLAFNPYLLWAGAIAQNDKWDEGLLSPLYPTFRARDGVYARYVWHMLRAPEALARFDGISFGSVPRKRRASTPDFLATRIPFPSFPEQRRIAEILDRADALRDRSVKMLQRLDEFEESLFVEAFGNLVANERGWPIVRVSDFVARFSSGKSIVGVEDGAPTRARVLKISAVTSGRFRELESKPLPEGYEPPIAHLVCRGDLLFSRANTRDLVGATAYVDVQPRGLALPDKLWRFEWPANPKTLPLFVWRMFSRPEIRAAIRDVATGSGGSMKNVSQSSVLGLRFALPDLEHQARFVEVVVTAERVRALIKTRQAALDELFASLQYRAFEGTL